MWQHRQSSEDSDFAVKLLHTAWQRHPDLPPLSRYVLGTLLGEIGTELRNKIFAGTLPVDPLWLSQRYIDMGGYLNAQHDNSYVLEPPIELEKEKRQR